MAEAAVDAYVCVLLVHLHFPETHSLKAKRAELRSVRAQLASRFGASVSEVGYQDLWQRSALAVSLCGGSASRLNEHADGVGRFLDARFEQGVRVERALCSLEDLLP